MFEATVYSARRTRLCALLREKGTKGLVLLAAHSQSPINYPSNSYPFRQDSNWLYYIGLNEPDMAVLIDIEDGSTRLFADELSMDDLIWTGPRPSLTEQAAAAGITEVLPLDSLRSATEKRLGTLDASLIQKDAEAGEMVREAIGDTGMTASDILPLLPAAIKKVKNW